MQFSVIRLIVGFLVPLGLQAVPLELPPEGLQEPPPLPDEVLQGKPALPPADLPDPSQLVEQLKQLEELLGLTPKELQGLRQTIEYVERMSASEREAMRIRLSQITQPNPILRREIEFFFRTNPRLSQQELSQYWFAATEEKRKAVRTALRQLSNPKARADFLSDEVETFIRKRDAAFDKMRKSLESRHQPPAP
jgi:hypothetical protein